MRKYQLYLIEDEFATHYFGRERLFFQLFHEHHKSNGELKFITQKQISYITKKVEVLKIHQLIQKQLGKIKGFKAEHGAYSIELSGKLSTAKLEVFQDLITIDAQGSYEAETAFFEVLRKCESSFMALDLEHQRYGWLKPIKERKFI
ncbi:sporulation inhibitor of replication protein SirA [Bacillus sp. ISL-40]|uniref:sporulation inhibitor of replication protein SirA n=1 Tax=unclassified Bacillus (in: firmicutes) TaxID=185979 RepID=UPI001BEC0404|nr:MULTISPECIES: sporulation inhibitor of replication protein SirA [unclassified Bacillus (in: firmicutes)]MBT2700362.1 sporulation inhibitor of replication protein SirA [Bacillus sp. ISL-40]MBT2721043.1 sporulation inhibitor of replication protein SirA [Bacillus sp. ISL-46]MBT2742395.1 sporulation inhibitor of replication protein SirA [Bacillus sp. ISL-77]